MRLEGATVAGLAGTGTGTGPRAAPGGVDGEIELRKV